MANVIEVLIKGLVSDEFKKALDQASQSVEGFANKVGQSVENINKRFEGMNKGFEALGKSMVGIGVALSIGITAPTVALAAGAVQAGANIEKLTVAFQPLLGSAQAATKRMAELQQFANLTPFELPEVAKASRMLEVMTKGVLATGDALRMVGDIASGVGQGFDEVAMWVGRLYDGLKSGRPVGEATMRLQEMGAMSGDTRNKLEEMAKTGAKFSEVWAVATQAFGRFAGGMELQANTVAGKISTLQDSANTALANLGRSFEDTTKKVLDLATALMDKLGALAQWFGDLPEPVKMVTLAIVALVAAIGPLLVAFGGILLAIPGLIAGWGALSAALGVTAAGIGALVLPITLVVAAIASWAIVVLELRDAYKAYREEKERDKSIEKATDDALERRGVGLEHRKALRKAGYDVGMGSETSQSQGAGSFATYMEQQGAAKAASDAAAAKVHEEFVKTDRATLIAKENERYKEQKAALGDNVAAIKELNALHKIALEDIDKKVGYKPVKAAAKVDAKDQQLAKNFEALGQERNADAALAEEEARLIAEVTAENERIKKAGRDDARKALAEQKKAEDALDQKRRDQVRWIGAQMGAMLSPIVNGFSSALSQLFAKGHVSVTNIVKTIREGLAQAAAEFITKMAVGGVLKLIGGAVGGPLGGGLMSYATGLMGFAVGTPRVPRDMLAQIHSGEGIIPSNFMDAIRAGDLTLGGPGGGGGHSASLVLGSDIMAAIKDQGYALAKIVLEQGRVSFA